VSDVPGRVASVVLAAGSGQRFGGDKLAAVWQGEPLLAHVLRAVASHPGVVVHRPGDAFVAEMARGFRMQPRENPAPELGLSGSLRIGLAALDPARTVWAMIVLGDQPLLRPEVIERLIAMTGRDRELIRPEYDGQDGPGHPVLVHRRLWRLAGELKGDQGFGAVVPPDRVCLVSTGGVNPDVDTPEDLAGLDTLSRLTTHDSRHHARPPR
jgi:CTP:molybdopterin cytidylyltransferase MocA